MKDFVAIDFETANYEPTSICSVGLVVVHGGEITQRMHRLVCPEPDYYIRRFSEQVHGIYPADTCGAPTFDAVWSEIVPWVEGLPFVAHNKAFDERVLRAACRMYGIDYTYGTFLCTLRQARRVIPPTSIANYRLPTCRCRRLCAHCPPFVGRRRIRNVRYVVFDTFAYFLPIYLRMVENTFLLFLVSM